MALETLLGRLRELFPLSIDLSLGRIARLLALLGRPDRHLPPVVHVAGTNGKGSVIAFLRAILEAAGYRVHVYTSPHLVRFNERIRLGGRLIEDEELEELLKDCIRANRGNPITFFEITTAAAFVAFARVPADVVLIETGLGGRLDATNLITQPYLTILTPISIDHQFHLGRRLMQIATEKAAILKSHCPAIVGAQTQSALRVITRVAHARAAPLWRQNYEWRLRHRAFGTVFESTAARRLFPIPGLVGNHQRDNAGIAVASLDQMPEFTVLDSALRVGLTQVEWPARLQLLASGSLTRNVPLDVQLWVDGGHNAAAGTALADAVRKHLMDRPLRLIVGMLDSKSPEEFLAPLAPYVERFWGISIAGESNSISGANLAICARRLGLTAEQAPNIVAAIKAASLTQSHVLICGSLYLAGQVLAANNGALTGRPQQKLRLSRRKRHV